MKVDEKSDVYSFGVVLLELITGKKPVGEFGDGVDIVQWVRSMTDSNKDCVLKVIDLRLSSVPVHEVTHVFYVALLCVEEQAVERPTMREVVQILTEIPKIPLSKQQAAESDVTEKAPAINESSPDSGSPPDLLSN